MILFRFHLGPLYFLPCIVLFQQSWEVTDVSGP